MALGQEDNSKCAIEKTNYPEMYSKSEQDFNSESKKRGFHPFRAVKKIFKRRGKHSSKDNEEEPRMASLKSRSTSELLAADDENRDGPSNGSNHLGSGLSMSHDSVFSPEHNNDNDIRNARSIQNIAMQKELMDRLHPHRDSDEDDVGLPYSPCTSPTTADVLQQGLREASVKSRSVCSDGSLLSMGSSENDEDSLYLQQPCQARLGFERRDDAEEGAASFPLNHKAAHHKISVRPKRTHAVGRHRKLQQLTVASLPATPEDLEESRGNSPDHSWPSIGEANCSSDSISRASSAMSTSDSADSFSAGTSPTLKKVLPPHSQEPIEIPTRSRLSTPDWRLRQENESISRRRTVSESPCKECDGRTKESTSTEIRADKAQSVMIMDFKDMSWASTSWSEYSRDEYSINDASFTRELKKDSKSVSPLWSDVHVENTLVGGGDTGGGSDAAGGGGGSDDRRPEKDSKVDDKLSQKIEFAIGTSEKSAVAEQTRVEFKSQQFAAEEVKTTVEPLAIKETEHIETVSSQPVAVERRTIQRDPSYRVAVHDLFQDSPADSSLSDQSKKEKEESSGLFSFGSKVKRNESAKDKSKKDEKSKKEEKAKKEEKKKEENESPFFSRFWGSRRSSKKKKEKSEPAESLSVEDGANVDAKSEPQASTDANSPMSTVDVKAMIQSLTARTNSLSPSSSIEKNRKPTLFPKKRSEITSNDSTFSLSVDSSSCSKSMESLSGPRSLDSAVNTGLSKPKPTKSKLSGSMPRLTNSSFKGEKFIYCDDTTEVAQENVMIVEGEIVHLRKKSLVHTEKKTLSAAAIEKPLNTNGESKRTSKKSSILSWYSKKESPPSLDYKTKKESPQPEKKQVQKSKSIPLPVEPVMKQPSAESSTSKKNKDDPTSTKSENESGVARLSGFWSSNTAAKENVEKSSKKLTSSFFKQSSKTKEGLHSSLQKRDSSSSSASESSITKAMSTSLSEKHVTRTPSPDKASRQVGVPEFMKLQLHKSKVSNEAREVHDEISKPGTPKSTARNGKLDPKVEAQLQTSETESTKRSSVSNTEKSNGLKKPPQPHDSSAIPNKASVTPKHSFHAPAASDGTKNGESPTADTKNLETPSKFSRFKKETKDGEPELMKVFHRRSLKIKDKDSNKNAPKENGSSAKRSMDERDQNESSVEHVSNEELRVGTPPPDVKENSLESMNGSGQSRSSMADKRSISLSQETAPPPRVRTNTSPGIAMAATAVDIAKAGEKSENGIPEWRRIAQQRREQREQRERQHVSSCSHPDSLILQNAPKHSGRSKVLDMVSNFQKLQVS